MPPNNVLVYIPINSVKSEKEDAFFLKSHDTPELAHEHKLHFSSFQVRQHTESDTECVFSSRLLAFISMRQKWLHADPN
jgi:hypothetical protein